MSLLDKINSPKDLRSLSIKELSILAYEIREKIIETVSITGGHLASSLGAVELCIILHYVFDTPKDKLVWDVGHQTYAHKILTGRKEKFDTLRQYNGISGFPNRDESEYDTFTVGHASTAVSVGLGMAVARDLKGENYKVISIIGDGSLTGGLTYEGLNNAGHINTDFIVVLNDNAMYISPPVGAVAKMLVRILTLGLLKKIEKYIDSFLRRLHYVGLYLLRIAKRFKLLFFPGMLFEEMGFAYIGPVDGHDIEELYEVFKSVKNFKGPTLVHVVTKKGYGYPPAEKNPTKFHSVGKFDKNTAELVSDNKLTFTKVFSETIVDLAEKNEKIVGITAAMTDGCGLEKFAKLFPKRFFDVGIAESHAVTFAAGLAVEGFIPVCSSYSTFLQRAFDQIIHDIALPKLHTIFVLDRAGIVGEDGPTHHGSFDLSYLRLIPNMVIMVPKDAEELKNMLYSAIDYDCPVAIRYPKDVVADYEKFSLAGYKKISLAENEIVTDISEAKVVIITCGPYVYEAKKIIEMLNLKAGLINLRFVKPLDEELLTKIKCEKIVVIEENTIIGGLYSAISEFFAKLGIKKQIMPICLPDKFIPHGAREILKHKVGLDTESIAEKIKLFLTI